MVIAAAGSAKLFGAYEAITYLQLKGKDYAWLDGWRVILT
jgi:hypothetical protein